MARQDSPTAIGKQTESAEAATDTLTDKERAALKSMLEGGELSNEELQHVRANLLSRFMLSW